MSDMDVYHTQNEGDRPVEKSPRGRYIRFDIRLGQGAYKTVWKAYDTDQGIDVAWNAIDIGVLPSSEKTRIIQEVQLLQKLEHKNIINFYGSWFSKEKNQVVFITEIMTSGTLKSYIKRVHYVKWKIIKRWCIQILEGLHYLHNQNPPVIHRDLKCDNIFINGNTGDLRIGDLGLSTQLAVHKRSKAQSVLGTPEFMAPELYDESYDEKVDIYAFGMCVLEMVTKEVPYSECINPAQIYKKVTAGIRPRGLQRIISQPARDFIELCLSRGNGKVDVSAEYLLDHPFLKASDDDSDMVKVLDEDELERDAPPLPPVSPPMNPKQFADELNMESGSKGKDPVATSDRRKNYPSLSLEPEELASASAGNSMAATSTGGGVQGQRTDIPAEEKSAGKHRMLLPPKVPTTANTAEPSAASSAAAATTTTAAQPSGNGGGNGSEPVVDEPLSDKKGEVNHHVDNFLSGLPPNEVNIRNDRIAVMGGRGHRIEIDEAQVYSDDEDERKSELSPVPENPPAAMSSSSQESERSAIANGSAAAAPTTANESAPNSAEPTRQRPSAADATRSTRPPSASRKRGKSYNIKATKDPENEHSILLNLRMALDGKSKEIKFPFNLFTDSSHEVACELAVDVGILEPDLEDIADSISFLVTEGKINNLPDFDQDVWDEAPEPHSFPTKALPHVSKLTFGSAPPAHPLTSTPLEIETVVTTPARVTQPSTPVATPATPVTPLVTPMSIRELSTGSTSELSGVLGDAGLPPLEAGLPLSSSASLVVERSLSPPLASAMVHAASESALYNPEETSMQEGREHSMSVGSAADANYLRSVRLYEDRMKMARSSYDERESSLETAIRNEEEKHQREIERIRKKMQEFNEKTARATMARQERMRLGTDEFKDVDGSLDEWNPTGSQGSAASSQPSVVMSSANEDTNNDRSTLEPSSTVPRPRTDSASASTTSSGVSVSSSAMGSSAVPDTTSVGSVAPPLDGALAADVQVTQEHGPTTLLS